MDFTILNILLLLGVLGLAWIRWRKKKFAIFSENGIPGPKPNFWTGNLTEIIEKRELFHQEYTKLYGNLFGYFVGALPVLNVTDPELIKRIQLKDFKYFTDKNFLLPNGGIAHPNFSYALGVQNGEKWKELRSIITPAFSTGKMRKMSDIINIAINDFLENIEQLSKNEEPFDIYKIHKKLTLDIISRTAFGISTDVQKGKHSSLVESINLVFGATFSDALPMFAVSFPELNKITKVVMEKLDVIRNYLGKSSIREIFDSCGEIVMQRKTSHQKRVDLLQGMIDGKDSFKNLSATKYEDLVATAENLNEKELINEHDSKMIKLTNEQIVANAVLFMTAGYDTSSSTLGYASYVLSKHPHVQEKLRDEIRAVIGEKEQIEYDDLLKMKYLDQVISEVLRLFPVNFITVSRVIKQPFTHNGMTIPKGVIISIPLWSLHKDSKYWTDPEEFNPERFSPENKSNINPSIYQPFGNGPRNCVGMRFAQTVIKFVLARLIMSYRLEPCHFDFTYHHTIFLVHPEKVMVRVRKVITSVSRKLHQESHIAQ